MRQRPASLKVRALQWLAQREHSPTELRVKLLRVAAGLVLTGSETLDDAGVAGLSEGDATIEAQRLDEARARRPGRPSAEQVAEVDAVLVWLTSHQYLSPERFVESRVNARQARYGNQRIASELQQHGLTLTPEARLALQDSELARAREVWVRKFGALASDPAERLRQMRFLAGRGFGHDVVRRVVREGPSDDG